MEGESSRFEVHTPVFDKKKKKYSVHKERPQKYSHEIFRDSSLVNEQCQITRRKKRKKDCQHLISSPLKKSRICDETENATSTLKKRKKRRYSALEVDEEAGVTVVLVDKENIDNTPEGFREGVDVVCVDTSMKQKSARELKTDKLREIAKSHTHKSEALHDKVREKKNTKHQRKAASCDALKESQQARDALPQSESHREESRPSRGPGDNITELPASAYKNKSKRKKKKKSDNQEYETWAIPEGSQAGSEAGSDVWESQPTVGLGGEPTERLAPAHQKKSKKKKKKKSTHQELEALAVPEEFDVLMLVNPIFPLRLEPANEEHNVESAENSETRYLSEDLGDADDSDADLGSAVRQLQEFIPNIKDRATGTIRRMYRDDLDRFKEFKAQGVAIKFGKFSVKENKQLEENVQDFLALTGIESADKLLYTDRYPEEKSVITNLKRRHSFRLHIGKFRNDHSDHPRPSSHKQDNPW
nr:transcription termination factor 1-like [Aotus nancymaae]